MIPMGGELIGQCSSRTLQWYGRVLGSGDSHSNLNSEALLFGNCLSCIHYICNCNLVYLVLNDIDIFSPCQILSHFPNTKIMYS